MWEKEDEIHFNKFKIKEIVASLKMPLSELEIVGSLTDDEKVRLAELLAEDNSESTDWTFADSDDNESCDSENESELVRTIAESVFALDSNFENYQGNNEKAASVISVEDPLDENDNGENDGEEDEADNNDDDDDDNDNTGEEDDDDDGIESLENSQNSIDSENYNPYNTDPELLTRLDQIDDKLKKLNNDYSKTMEDLVKFQENDFDLKTRLKDIDDSLKKLSCDNTSLFYFDQNPETCKGENQEECKPNSDENKEASDNVLMLNSNENIFNLNYGDACDCSENWANVKKKYDLQIHKIEDMLEKLCETNDKNIFIKNEEELRERGNREAEYEID